MARPPKIEQQVTEMTSGATNIAPGVDAPKSGVEEASWISRHVTRPTVGKLIEPLTKPGAKIDPEYKVKPPEPEKVVEPPVEEAPSPEAEVQPMEDVPPDEALAPEPPKEPKTKVPDPVSAEYMEERMAAREEYMGGPRTAPSGKGEGVIEGPVNTKFYDSDTLAATVQAMGEVEPDYKSRTVQSFYDRAIMTGVPKRMLDQLFKGIPMESKVGDHKLAENIAGLQILHDISATRVDELMAKALDGELDEMGKLELREAMAQHEIILSELKGVKRDVARSMNVFKNTYEKGTPSALDVRSALESQGGDDQLMLLAHKYMAFKKDDPNYRSKRNGLLERGVIGKSYDSIMYGAQAMALSAPGTILYNVGAGISSIFMDVPERLFAMPMAIPRKLLGKILRQETDPDRYTLDDILARASGMRNGILDGIMLAGRYISEGKTSVKGEVIQSPLTPEYWSNTPLIIAGREIGRLPDNLEDKPAAYIIRALGFLPNLAMKSIGVTDELVGGLAQRMELHEQGARLARRTYDDAILAGEDREKALAMAQVEADKLLTERPHDIEVSTESWRKQVTLQSDIKKVGAMGNAMWWSNRIMKMPPIKPLVLFSKSLLNLASEGAARTPFLNFVSPRFYSEFAKGGRHRDLALGRVAYGYAMFEGGRALYENGFTTGPGPSDTEEKNTWRSMGWQPFSFIVDLEDWGGESGVYVERLKNIPGFENAVSFGSGQFEGKMFISFSRLEPANLPFVFGSAWAETSAYHEFDPTDEEGSVFIDASLATLSEFSTVVPQMTVINELVSIFGQRQSDKGEKATAVITKIAEQYANIAIMGTPVVGYTNSSMANYIEGILNPEVQPTAMTMAQKEWAENNFLIGEYAPAYAVKGAFEALNRWRNKIPAFNKDAPAKLDAWGDPISKPGSLITMIPTRVTFAKPDRTKELVAALRHGIREPNYNIHGVYLPQEVQERYKQLYAKDIKINNETMSDAIYNNVTQMIDDGNLTGIVPKLGDLQAEIDSTVNAYKAAARERMFGKTKNYGKELVYTMQGVGVNYGLTSDKVEYPDLALEIQKAHRDARLVGR